MSAKEINQPKIFIHIINKFSVIEKVPVNKIRNMIDNLVVILIGIQMTTDTKLLRTAVKILSAMTGVTTEVKRNDKLLDYVGMIPVLQSWACPGVLQGTTFWIKKKNTQGILLNRNVSPELKKKTRHATQRHSLKLYVISITHILLFEVCRTCIVIIYVYISTIWF